MSLYLLVFCYLFPGTASAHIIQNYVEKKKVS